MSCSCCGTHAPTPTDTSGTAVTLSRPLVTVEGRLTCADMGQMLMALDLLPRHVELSRAEPGCLRFDIAQGDDPLVWTLDEVFADEDAFAAHQARNADSQWGRDSQGISRDLHCHALHPLIRPELPSDHKWLDRLLTAAFGHAEEAQLLADLRADGDLAVSLVAHVRGLPVGHAALAPLLDDRPGFSLASLAVHPALQGRGLGQALLAAVLAEAGEHPVVVRGDAAFCARAGFQPLAARTRLMVRGDLPGGGPVIQAPAFARL